jgi:hypothetical protein
MKTYAEYQKTNFVTNIDEANGRIHQLEAKCGKPRSDFESNLDVANRKIWELENGGGAKSSKGAAPSAAGGEAPKDTTAEDSIVGFYQTGKSRGVHKAMGAAIERARS